MLIRIKDALRNDNGAAMASVLALILVGALLSILIMSSVITGLGNTTATRASVQAQAAAKAGIAAAYVGLKTGTCASKGGVYESATEPKYRATIWFGTARGCPTGGGQYTKVRTRAV